MILDHLFKKPSFLKANKNFDDNCFLQKKSKNHKKLLFQRSSRFSGSPPSLIPAHWNIDILLHKQAKLRKYMQHSVRFVLGLNSAAVPWFIHGFALIHETWISFQSLPIDGANLVHAALVPVRHILVFLVLFCLVWLTNGKLLPRCGMAHSGPADIA